MDQCLAYEYVEARGHVNIRATHRTTFEITRESHLTPRGDCIIGVEASKAPGGFSSIFRSLASRNNSVIIAVLCGPDSCDVVLGRGSSSLSLSDPVRMVFRKSTYTGGETVMIRADKAAADLSRSLVNSLRDPGSRLHLVLIALDPTCMSTE